MASFVLGMAKPMIRWTVGGSVTGGAIYGGTVYTIASHAYPNIPGAQEAIMRDTKQAALYGATIGGPVGAGARISARVGWVVLRALFG